MDGTHAAQGQGNHEIKALVLHQVSPFFGIETIATAFRCGDSRSNRIDPFAFTQI
jgi:hypothetical protein